MSLQFFNRWLTALTSASLARAGWARKGSPISGDLQADWSGWRNSSLLHSICYPLEGLPRLDYMVGVAGFPDQQEGKPQSACIFQASTCITSANDPLPKANYMVKPRVPMGGDYGACEHWEIWKEESTDTTVHCNS